MLISLIGLGCKSQDYPSPLIEVIKPNYSRGIEYIFPQKLQIELHQLVEKVGVNASSFFILSQFSLHEYEISYCHWDKVVASDEVSDFVAATNRYCQVQNTRIPLVIHTDLLYSNNGFVIQCRSQRIRYSMIGNKIDFLKVEY